VTDVFIGATATTFPTPLPERQVAEKLYPSHRCSARVTSLAKRFGANFGIRQRAICIDLERIPETVLAHPSFHPLAWCTTLIKNLSTVVPVDQVGYLGVAYNTSLHTDTLPNLACQAAIQTDITTEIVPEEFAHYGCAGGFFPLQTAIHYCRHNQKAAIVIVFDQCSSRCSFSYDPSNVMFKMNLKANLLFSDGAAAVLLIPARMRPAFNRPVPKIVDLRIDFQLSDTIRFQHTHFILSEQLKHEIPSLVVESVIHPLCGKHGVQPSDIAEWSMHQGGKDILAQFADLAILGLTEHQLARSAHFFKQLGNMSAPSCFVVLDSFVREDPHHQHPRYGAVVGFGAGFYQACLLYRWH
jgi:3-oxoacyl-[acyl-carrier-protein] synthase III